MSAAKAVGGNTLMKVPETLQFLLDYIGEKPADREYRHKTEVQDRQIMLGSPDEAALLRWLLELQGGKKVVEVGAFRGTTTVQLAYGVGAGGQVDALDITSQWLNDGARAAWEAAGVSDRIRFHEGPAVASMEKLIADGGAGTYDMIFIDADKENYPKYYELGLQLLKQNGVIAVDNSLWGGRVMNPQPDDADTVAISSLIKKIRDDDRVSAVMVGIADGVYLCRKK